MEVSTTPFNSFYELYQMFLVNALDPNLPDVLRLEFASRFLPLSLAEMDPALAAKIILSLSSAGGVNVK